MTLDADSRLMLTTFQIRFSRLDDTTMNSVKEKIAAMAENGI